MVWMKNKVKSPKISIIVPIYNVEAHLAACLDSLTSQSLKDIEIICIDDGATDDSAKILKQYASKDSRIIVVRQKNTGLSGARNSGLKHATAPLIMFCDSDDYYDQSMCEIMYDAMTESGADMAICGINNLYQNGVKPIASEKEYFRLKYTGLQEVSEKLILQTDVPVCNKIFKRDILETYNINFPEGLNNEDNYFYFA